MLDRGIECAEVYQFTSLKLIVFGACWQDYVGGKQLTFQETYKRFKEAFLVISMVWSKQINDIQVDLFQYDQPPGNNGIYTMTTSRGTVALWQRGERGYAPMDEDNQHQSDGVFEGMLGSFRFLQ